MFLELSTFELVLMFVALGAPEPGAGRTYQSDRGSRLQACFVACAIDMAVTEYCETDSEEREQQREKSLREVLLDGPLFPSRGVPQVSTWLAHIRKFSLL